MSGPKFEKLPECPTCRGEVQLTRKTYWSVVDGILVQDQADQPDVWALYCENDHIIINTFEAYESELLDIIINHLNGK